MPTQRQLIRSRWNWQEISLFKEWQSAMIYEVFMSRPASLVEVVRVVRQLDSARKACQSVPSVEKKKSVNAVSASADGDKISNEIRELKEIVLGMNEKIRELERKAETTSTARLCNDMVCFACRQPGHFARSCPYKEGGNRGRGLPRARQSP